MERPNATPLQVFAFVKTWYGNTDFMERGDGWIPPWIAPLIASRLGELFGASGGYRAMRGAFSDAAKMTPAQLAEVARPVAEYCLEPLLATLTGSPAAQNMGASATHSIFEEVERQFSFDD